MVAHTCNPNYLGAEIGRFKVWGQAEKKVSEIPSQPIS
jgi:hypothetical protein